MLELFKLALRFFQPSLGLFVLRIFRQLLFEPSLFFAQLLTVFFQLVSLLLLLCKLLLLLFLFLPKLLGELLFRLF